MDIRIRTFLTYFNFEHLHDSGLGLRDIEQDLRDGILLVRIVESLQKRKCIGRIQREGEAEWRTSNVQLAVEALREDGIRIANSEAKQIAEGNTTTSLSLLWKIIQRYHIPCAKGSHQRDLLMAWLQAVMPPELELANFRTSWNDGVMLGALANYCRPDLIPQWRTFDHRQGFQNCELVLGVAEQQLGIPIVVSAGDLSSRHLDEQACITYLAYYVRKEGPGYLATLRDVQRSLNDVRVMNFERAWSDGFLLCRLVESLGGRVAGFSDMLFDDPARWSWNVSQALNACTRLGINTSLLACEDIAATQSTNRHLGLLALCATLCSMRRHLDTVMKSPSASFGSGVDGRNHIPSPHPITTCAQKKRVSLELIFSTKSNRRRNIDVVIFGPSGDRFFGKKSPIVATQSTASITFVPELLGPYQIHILYNNKELPTSPVHLMVIEQNGEVGGRMPSSASEAAPPKGTALSDAIPVEGLILASELPTSQSIDSEIRIVVNETKGVSPKNNVSIFTISPAGDESRREVRHIDGAHECSFLLDAIGEWQMVVMIDGRQIRGSPFHCQCFDPNSVLVYGLEVGLVGQELRFTVDASKAGRGDIKVVMALANNRFISSTEQGWVKPAIKHHRHGQFPVPHRVEEVRKDVYEVCFTPNGAGQYSIGIEFNRMEVKGSPFLLDIANASAVAVYGESLHRACVNRIATFFVHSAKMESKDLAVVVTRPTGEKQQPIAVPLDESTHKFEWRPIEPGEHSIDVQLCSEHIGGSPFTCSVGEPEKVVIKNMPSEIIASKLETEHSFEIDAVAAGSGSMEIVINEGRVPCRVKELVSRRFQAAFTPVEAVDHTVELKFNNEHVPHSPWTIPLVRQLENGSSSHQAFSGERGMLVPELAGEGLHRAEVGSPTSFDLKCAWLKAENLIVRLTDSDGKCVDVKIIGRPAGDGLRCEYTLPKKVGEYLLEALINGRPVEGSPFHISGYDPAKIRVQPPLEALFTEQPVHLMIDAVEAGRGQLEISVNQGKVPNNVQMQDAGRCLVTFIPQHAGTYVIDVTFNGQQVHGCPIKVDVQTTHVGTAVSTPVYPAGAAGVAGSPLPPRAPSSVERGPSSAYYSGVSPQHADTYSSCAPTPSPGVPSHPPPPPPQRFDGEAVDQQQQLEKQRPVDSPRSPLLVSYVQQKYSSEAAGRSQGSARMSGGTDPTPTQSERMHGELRSPRLVTAYDSQVIQPKPPQVGYTVAQYGQAGDGGTNYWTGGLADSRGLEMTRSAALNLYREEESVASKEHVEVIKRVEDLPLTPLEEPAKRTADSMRVKEEDERILEQHGYAPYESGTATSTKESKTVGEPESVPEMEHEPYIVHSHVVEPYSDIESLTPGTRRKLLEHSVYKTPDLVESEIPRDDEGEGGDSESKSASKPTTPRLGMKFRRGSEKSRGSEGSKLPFEFGKSKITSKHEVVRRERNVEVKVESLKVGKEDQLKVVVTPPTRKLPIGEKPPPPELNYRLRKSGKTYIIDFTPSEVGTHKVLVFVNNVPHPQTPFPIRVYDASQIMIGEIAAQSFINNTVNFTVDAGRAGFGNLEMAIKDSDGLIIPSHVSQLETGAARFLVTFTPTTAGVHTVNITFNKELVEGSPFSVNIVDTAADGGSSIASVAESKSSTLERKKKDKVVAKQVKQQKNGENRPLVSKMPSLARVDRPAEVVVLLPSMTDTVDISVADPDKKHLSFEVFDDSENRAKRIEFTPHAVGDHELTVKVGGVLMNGSPFTCRAYDPAMILVGPVPDGCVGKAVHFIVDASSAGVGNLEVAVNEGKIQSMAHALGQHKYDISFVPQEAIDHTISVRFNNEPVPGSPFVSRLANTASARQISVSGPGLERIQVGEPVELLIDTSGMPKAAGQLLVAVTDSKGALLPVEVTQRADGCFLARYTAQHIGNHQVDISYDGDLVKGSPFTSKAFDASAANLMLSEKAVVGKPCTFDIDAAKAGAGNMEIIVSVGSRNVPNFVHAEGQARFKVSFTPHEPAEHVLSVKFNGVHIPGSPMRCPVSNGENIHSLGPETPASTTTVQYVRREEHEEEELSLVGDLAAAQVGKVKRFSIDAPTRGQECNVTVTHGVNRTPVPVKIVEAREGLDVEFIPNKPGDYEINIQLAGKPLAICPLICSAVSLPSDQMPNEQKIEPGKLTKFEVELYTQVLRSADRLESEIYDEVGKYVDSSIEVDSKRRKAIISFTPASESSRYFATILSNGLPLAGGDRVFSSRPSKKPSIASNGSKQSSTSEGVKVIKAPEKALVDQSAEIILQVKKGLEKRLQIEINDPDGNILPVSLTRLSNKHSSLVADWRPTKEGQHSIFVRLDEHPVEGTPIFVDALDLSAVHVVGLDESGNGVVGSQQTFKVDWTNSGGSNITVAIRHETGSELSCQLKKLGTGIHACIFTPRLPGLYLVDISIDGHTLPECPYECLTVEQGAVRARGDALMRAQRGRTARFEVSLGSSDKGELDVLVTDENKTPLPVRCYRQHDDSYWVEFTPEQCGKHKIEVTFADMPIPGSPFSCEVVDPRRVIIRGTEAPLTVNNVSTFVVDRRQAGNGELKVEVADPHSQPCKLNQLKTPTGEDSFTFLPTQLGPYKLNTTFSGFVVPGMPKTVLVEEQSKPSVYGAATEYAVEKGQPASLIFDSKKLKGGLKVDVRGPNNERVRHSIGRRPDDSTEISFKPGEVGEYTVGVEFNNKPIGGSPFKVNVVDPTSVLVAADGTSSDSVFHMLCNRKNPIDVDGATAGPGTLRAELRNLEGELIPDTTNVLNMGSGEYRVEVEPKEAGQYKLYFYWAELVVPCAYPLLIDAAGGSEAVNGERRTTKKAGHLVTEAQRPTTSNGGAAAATVEPQLLKRVVLSGKGLSHAVVREEAEFLIDCSQLPPSYAMHPLSATLVGESEEAAVPVTLSPLRDHFHKGTYTPLAGGRHELSVMLGGRHVAGSPTQVDIQGYSTPAELIEVDTKTLKLSIIGEELKTLIDARRAGSGELTAQCAGPSQLEYCELFDNGDGTYTLLVTPRDLGKHTLTIKYDGQHIQGSPFVFNVANPPDPSQVRVYGNGIQHGVLHNYDSNFVVETKGAGAGQLSVRVRGPKGAFNVEMLRDRHNDRTIHCKYDPKEPGDYQIEVKWHGMHVPGSPFFVLIMDTEVELQRYLASGVPSPPPTSPFIPPGLMMGGMGGWAPPPLPPPHFGPIPVPVPVPEDPYGYVIAGPPRPMPPHGSRGRRSNY